jgi:phospholipase/lecithinase/hemolysin
MPRITPARVLPALLLAASAAHADFTGLVVFGDSLSDTGNSRSLPFVSRPGHPFYAEGRWTNDAVNTALPELNMQAAAFSGVWHERLADRLRLTRATNSRAGGARATNYAYGGATTPEGINISRTVLGDIETGRNMGTQIRDYLSTVASGAVPVTSLYVFWGGGNDLRDRARAAQPTADNLRAAARDAVANIEAQIRLLGDHVPSGQRITVLWPNVPPLEATPEAAALAADVRTALGAGCEAFRTQQLAAFNRLRTDLPAIEVKTLDVHSLFRDLVAGRLAWVPADTTRNIIAAGDFAAATFTPQRNPAVAGRINPDDYVFWDQLHPTSRVHMLLGDYAANIVPAPGPIALVLSGMLCLARRRRAA